VLKTTCASAAAVLVSAVARRILLGSRMRGMRKEATVYAHPGLPVGHQPLLRGGVLLVPAQRL